jgi:aspartokinase-like uncharacterized kinase
VTSLRQRSAVIKIGGGLLATAGALDRSARAVARAAEQHPLVVVPGGGPFAETVRRFDAAVGLASPTAHWMAILAQDQYAYVLAERIPAAALVWNPVTIAEAQQQGMVPILAPSRWMQAADVLPHSWDATSDSVAAFVAGAIDASVLVLVKPVGGIPAGLTDPCFSATLPAGLRVIALADAEVDRLGALLGADRAGGAASGGPALPET